MREQVEQVTNEAELPYKPKGWRNLYLVLISVTTSDGTHHVEGSTVWGTKIHPSKEAAIAALGTRGTAFTSGHFEWLGAFEVEE